jgi:hypothetical protein
MGNARRRRVRVGIAAAILAVVAPAGGLLAPAPAGAGGGGWLYPHRGRYDPAGVWVTAAEVRAGYRPTATTIAAPAPPAPAAPEPAAAPVPAATPATDRPPPSPEPVADPGKSPAGRAGADPAGGVSSEVVAWLIGLGVLVVVWCLAWRWRPPETIVVRHGGGHGPPPSDIHDAPTDDPDPVHIEL